MERRKSWASTSQLPPTPAALGKAGADVQTRRGRTLRQPAKVESEALELNTQGAVHGVSSVAPDVDDNVRGRVFKDAGDRCREPGLIGPPQWPRIPGSAASTIVMEVESAVLDALLS